MTWFWLSRVSNWSYVIAPSGVIDGGELKKLVRRVEPIYLVVLIRMAMVILNKGAAMFTKNKDEWI